jgi:tetratricopeptide (TPR) repeat protein
MRQWMPIAALLAITSLCGCAGLGDRISDFLRAGSWWQAAQTNDIRLRAETLEEQGELAMALDHWRLIERITIDHAQARREILRLEGKIAEAVRTHYQTGTEKMKAGEVTAARNHFLAALRLDPSFQPARQQIKAGFTPFPLVVYRTAAGERPAAIAKTVFGDADNAFLVSWFNDLPDDAVLPPDTLLILPHLQKEPPKKPLKKQPLDHLGEARRRLSEGDIAGALALTRQLNAADPAVQSLMHAIHLKQAVIQTEKGLLDEAGQSLAMVPEGFTGKENARETLQAALQRRQLALDLDEALRLYNDKDYQQSLDLATTVLARSPQNSDARHLADEARYRLAQDLFDHQQLLKARTVLEQASDDHAPSTALKKTVTKRLMELAQMHYRNGVKRFINEDLKAAVDEWEQALICNPDHEKARENIENARRIMQKIESLP